LLKINPRKINFVGVYHENQDYDFTETSRFIEKSELNYFKLHEIRGDLEENQLFEQNSISNDLNHIFQNSVGIFFFGGADIPPSVYGEENSLSVVTESERHYFETTFLFHLLGGFQNENFTPYLEENPEYFITGFCLGMQTMNVATGGTLIQDIPAEIYGATNDETTLQTGKENLHRNYWQNISDDPQLMGINFHTIHFTDHPFFTRKVKAGKNHPDGLQQSPPGSQKAGQRIGSNRRFARRENCGRPCSQPISACICRAVSPRGACPARKPGKRKFHPEDEPLTYHEIIGKEGIKFHKKYWNYISKTLKKAGR
jgi:putative glutamine amidotransferase